MKMGATTSTYFPFSQLEVLGLYQISDLKSLPEERLQNLISHWELYIKRCDGLGSLHWIGILTSLQSLNIWECPKLISLPQGIHNLTSLYENVPNWKLLEQTMKMGATTSTYFPLSQLEVLGLYQISDLKSLPEERLQNLISH